MYLSTTRHFKIVNCKNIKIKNTFVKKAIPVEEFLSSCGPMYPYP